MMRKIVVGVDRDFMDVLSQKYANREFMDVLSQKISIRGHTAQSRRG